jgi:cytochrome P450
MLVFCLSGCSAPAKEVNLSDVMDQIQDAVQLDSSMQDLTMDQISTLYGISSAQVEQFAGKIATSGILADEIIMIEAKDADAAKEIKSAVDARYQAKLDEMKDYLPDEYSKSRRARSCRQKLVAMFIASEQSAQTMIDLFNAAQ